MSEAKFHIFDNQLIACFPKGNKVIKIPDSVKSIENGAFRYQETLTNIIIPDSVTEIGKYAFRDCTSVLYHWYLTNLTYIYK